MSNRHAESSAPDFCLTDTTGNMICLSDYKDKRHVVLVFTRGFT